MNDYAAVIDDIFVNDRPIDNSSAIYEQIRLNTYMPISQTMPIASSDERILASTSHEWSTVSPIGAHGFMYRVIRNRKHAF